MNNEVRFRNHISIIIEELGATFWFIFILIFSNLINNLENIKENMNDMMSVSKKYELAIPVILIILCIIIIWRVNRWRKTYIYVDDGVLVVERNTLYAKKDTIAIKNISNVNTEQNLFEVLMRTCKVKLDTNTLSTANSTDVKIVLKANKAEEFKENLLKIINNSTEINEKANENATDDYMVASTNEIIKHGLYSANLYSIILFIGCIIGLIMYIIDMATTKNGNGNILTIVSNILLMCTTGLVFLWNNVKDFIKFWNYRIKRNNDKINIKYGLLKKVDYTIPVSTINAIKLKQTLIARIFKKYRVEIVNVGLGDDDDESNSFFLLYGSKKEIYEKIHALLPEFDGCLGNNIQKCPKCSWIIWSIPISIFLLVVGFGTILSMEIVGKFYKQIIILASCVCIIGFIVLLSYYFTAGISVNDKYLVLSKGHFGKEISFIQYGKIQHITVKQNFIARHFNMSKGEVYILANLTNQIQDFPYCIETNINNMREKILLHDTRTKLPK